MNYYKSLEDRGVCLDFFILMESWLAVYPYNSDFYKFAVAALRIMDPYYFIDG